MSQGVDIELVRENYRRMSDMELIRIATTDAAGITPEALEVVREELQKRNLVNVGIVEATKIQNRQITVEELDSYCALLRGLHCPVCGSNIHALNATMVGTVKSFILFTQYSKKLKVACPSCLDKANNNALVTTVLLGWWGFPWGIIRSVQAIGSNMKSKRSNHADGPNDSLRSFTLSNIGQVKLYEGNPQRLQHLIMGKL